MNDDQIAGVIASSAAVISHPGRTWAGSGNRTLHAVIDSMLVKLAELQGNPTLDQHLLKQALELAVQNGNETPHWDRKPKHKHLNSLVKNGWAEKPLPGRWRLSAAGRIKAGLADSPIVARLKHELDELQSQYFLAPPQVLRRIQRILTQFERPNSITRFVKRTRGPTCQMCKDPGFRMRNGKRYCEVHHLFHISKEPPPECLTAEFLVVLCANCHRRMHFAVVGEPIRDGGQWRVRVDETEYWFAV